MNPQIFSFEAMGAVWKITLWKDTHAECIGIIDTVIQNTREFEYTYSRFIETSYICSLSDHTGIVQVPQDFYEMLSVYKKLYGLSQKKFTPLIGSVLNDLGYDATYSLTPKKSISHPPDFLETVRIGKDSTILLRAPVSFDIGALGKGYSIDMISNFLRTHGCKQFLIDGSGDLFYEGDGEEIRVGLQDPRDPEKVIGIVHFKNGGLCGSGGDKRRWGEYHHIIDPISLCSPKDILATWVSAQNTVIADALATCLFLCDPKDFQKDFSFEYCIMYKDCSIKNSAGFSAEFF